MNCSCHMSILPTLFFILHYTSWSHWANKKWFLLKYLNCHQFLQKHILLTKRWAGKQQLCYWHSTWSQALKWQWHLSYYNSKVQLLSTAIVNMRSSSEIGSTKVLSSNLLRSNIFNDFFHFIGLFWTSVWAFCIFTLFFPMDDWWRGLVKRLACKAC